MSKGPGDPNCRECSGRGVIPAPAEAGLPDRGKHPPRFRRCACVLQRDIASNVERGMKKLMEATPVGSSPLVDYLDRDVWVTAHKTWFTAHLRHVAIRQPPTWFFKVVSDADLMTAWLASVALKGGEIRDPDASKVSTIHLTLTDLVTPPELLVIRLGVKVARNVATPEVLLEALRHREHLGLPTWVWDTPREQLAEGHICWSPLVDEYLSSWKHLRVRDAQSAPAPRPNAAPTLAATPGWIDRPDRTEDADPDEYMDQEPEVSGETDEVPELRGADGHVDLTPRRPFRPTMSSGGGRKSLRDEGGDK